MDFNSQSEKAARLVSVSGAAHSGTTLLASMIGSHPKVHLLTYETGWFLDSAGGGLALKALKSFSREGIFVVVEKTPRHVYHINQISRELPQTRFLVTVRNPLDLVASLFVRFEDWDIALNRVIEDFEAIDAVSGLDDVLFIRYENLVQKTSQTLRQVCQHIHLNFSAEIVNWYKSPPSWFGVQGTDNKGVGEIEHVKRRAWQVQQPLFDGRGRWKQELDSNQILMANRKFHLIAKRWGYQI